MKGTNRRAVCFFMAFVFFFCCKFACSGIQAKADGGYPQWLSKWYYIQNVDNKTITLKGYTGVNGVMEKDVTIPASTEIYGITYTTVVEDFTHANTISAVGGKEKYKAIETVTFEKGVKAAPSISMLFANCEGIKQITFNGFDISSCRSLDRLFYHCSSLEKVDLETLDTSNIEDMSDLFEGCYSIKHIQFDSLNTKKLKQFPSFVDCGNAVIDMRKNDISSLSPGGLGAVLRGSFSGELYLPEALAVPSDNPPSLDFISNLKGTPRIHFPGTKKEWERNYGGKSDNQITVGRNVKLYFDGDGTWVQGPLKKRIGERIEYQGIKYAIAGYGDDDDEDDISSYKFICLGPAQKDIQNLKMNLYITDADGDKEYAIKDKDGYIYEISDIKIRKYAFRNCTKLKTVEIATDGITIETGAFKGCKNLTSLKITGGMDFGVRAFYQCKKLKNITLYPIGQVSVGRDSFDEISKKAVLTTNKKDKNLAKNLKNKGSATITKVKIVK